MARDRDDGYPPGMTTASLAVATVACNTCRHRFTDGRLGCNAFPTGAVPAAILRGVHSHREPYPGDRGIQYAPVVEG